VEYDESTKFFTDHDEDQDLWSLLTHAGDAILRAREKELLRYSISPEQAGLLFMVQAMNNRATPAVLARYSMKEPHTISSLVVRMVQRGLVRTTKDLDRKNLVRVASTEKGMKVYELSCKRGPIHRIIGQLSPEEKKLFRRYLEKIYSQARKEIGLDNDSLPSSEE
jgi:MarR family transcriptional regulator, organic hydroperoxide resistance regulator